MSNKIITERYEANIHLNSLYDVLISLQANGKFWYPDDIKEAIESLLNQINKHIYHDHTGYDVVNETWYSEFEFKKN